jgi:hypothetical protein
MNKGIVLALIGLKLIGLTGCKSTEYSQRLEEPVPKSIIYQPEEERESVENIVKESKKVLEEQMPTFEIIYLGRVSGGEYSLTPQQCSERGLEDRAIFFGMRGCRDCPSAYKNFREAAKATGREVEYFNVANLRALQELGVNPGPVPKAMVDCVAYQSKRPIEKYTRIFEQSKD